jgi:hypothetical protein
VGTFSNTSFTFNPSLSIATNILNIETSGGWDQFTLDTSSGQPDSGVTNTVTTGGLAGGGKIAGTVTDNNSGATKADFFNTKLLYVWVFNSSSVSAATQMGIFTAGSGASTPWVFPTNAGGLGDNVTLLTDSSDTPNMTALVGSTSSNSLNLVASVPEPSALATLFGAGGLLMMIRRRRA